MLWIFRLNYLNEPESDENENYIENYYMLHGFIEKPRIGILVTFYSGINKTAFIIGTSVLIFLGVYLFFYNKFEIFIRLNILILIIALIISIILAIVTWHKRWYDAMGFLFKKQK
jgi:presenilin-like A22 family membrane protease